MKLVTRLATFEGGPKTIDIENRSVEVIAATENAVRIFDWEYGSIDEVLLMDGVELPESRQIPFLDSHDRTTTRSVVGSLRNIRVENGQLIGRAVISAVAEDVFLKIKEGHLPDVSVGYRPVKRTMIQEGSSATIRGRNFSGPLLVTERWRLKELSTVPIGADESAKARAENNIEEENKNKTIKEHEEMDAKLRAFLERLGLRKDASEDDAWAFYYRTEGKKTEQNEVKSKTELDSERAEATRIERERAAEIKAIGDQFGCHEIADRCVNDGSSLDTARKAIMDHMAKNNVPINTAQRATIEQDELDKFRSAAEDSLLMRGHVQPRSKEKWAPGADELRGYSLRELCRMALQREGKQIGGDAMEMVGRAITTTDLSNVFANVANKSLLTGYDLAPETWSMWCDTGSLPDFKQATLARIGWVGALSEVKEHAPYKYAGRTDGKEVVTLVTYGVITAMTRQAIINDDIGALTDTPMEMGREAAAKVGDLAYAVLTGGASLTMGDGNYLFSSAHSNYVASGSGAVPGVTTIGAGVLAMGVQKAHGSSTRPLNLTPEYFIGPKALETAAEVFFGSTQYTDSNTVATDSAFASTRTNPWGGRRFTRVYDARIDAVDAAYWYLAARKGMTVRMYFLNGVETPTLESQAGWSVDGIEWKVRIDAAAVPRDWKGLYMNDGN